MNIFKTNNYTDAIQFGYKKTKENVDKNNIFL